MGGLDTFDQQQVRASKQQQRVSIQILLDLATQQSRQRTLIALRAPYVIADFAHQLDHAIATYDYRVHNDPANGPHGIVFDVIAQWFNGEFEARGKLPVEIKPIRGN